MNKPAFEYRISCSVRPPRIGHKQLALAMPEFLIRKQHEFALTASLMTHRRLFGEVYAGLQPDYFWNMPADSGVYLIPVVPTDSLVPGARNPGDIDLLVLPYEGDTLVLHRVVAMEIKVLRATYAKQGKSPNDFGVSQTKALLELGFPYVALAHLIVSDESPQEAWREVGIAQVIDRQGRVEFLSSRAVDWLPIDLMKRSFGRLTAATPDGSGIGLVAAYLDTKNERVIGDRSYLATWMPETRRAIFNERASMDLLQSIAELFAQTPSDFLDTPRYDPA